MFTAPGSQINFNATYSDLPVVNCELKKIMTKIFKKIVLGAGLALLGTVALAQNGLNGIVVEKYYVSNAIDSAYSSGLLPVGSVTYRIYADMLHGYKFQAAYGNAAHLLKVTTSTGFFNDQSNGATTPDNITKASCASATTMLDSWVSAGAGCKLNGGLLKSDDNGVATVVNNTPAAPGGKILQGTDLQAGIPVKTQDGLINVAPQSTTIVGTLDLTHIDGTSMMSTTGDSIGTNNGAWSALSGSQGPLWPASNRVLIGQFTTNGVFHFELNIQVGDSVGGTQKFVTSNPNSGNGEFTIASLVQTFTPIVPPTCNITVPANHATFITGSTVNITATATSSTSTIDSVQFFVDGNYIGSDLTNPYNASWVSTVGTHYLTAVATAHDLGQRTSPVDTILVTPAHGPYGIVTTLAPCTDQSFCIPLSALDPIDNIIGYDLVLHYDNSKVSPSGNITIFGDAVNTSWVASPAFSINAAMGTMNISILFNGSAPATAKWSSATGGRIICVQFNKTGGFGYLDSAQFTVSGMQESYNTGVVAKSVDPGYYKSFKDSTLHGTLTFWGDNSLIKYNSAQPTQYLVTNIKGANASCANSLAAPVQPDLSGNFLYNLSNGLNVNIVKDIAASTDVQPVINGFDAFLTRKVLLNDASFIPNAYQVLAMDVNRDGAISAGDLSQINQRTVLIEPEFKQAWDYNASGVKTCGSCNSLDWYFINATTVGSDPAYNISAVYPNDDGVGYSKYRVPVVPFCLTTPLAGQGCQLAANQGYKGILVGDVNGNWSSNVAADSLLRRSNNDKVVFDLSKAVVKDGYADVPVSVISDNNVNALDFAIQLNGGNLSFNSIVGGANYLEMLSNFNADDNTMRFTSNSLQNYELGKSLLSVRFSVKNGMVSESDLNSVQGYLNGERVPVALNNGSTSSANVDLYPNPATGLLNVTVSEDATIQLTDMEGRSVIIQTNVTANQKQVINTQSLAAGVYMMKVNNDNFVTTKKVIITK